MAETLPSEIRSQWLQAGVRCAMGTMKTRSSIRRIALSLIGLSISLPIAYVWAQSTGRIEFTARVAPSAGQAEPVRQLTFYLLRKSMEDIRAEAAQSANG